MATKNRRPRRNNKSLRRKRNNRVGAGRDDDKNLRDAATLLGRGQYDNGDAISESLDKYLLSNPNKDSEDYKKVDKINNMLIEGYRMMKKSLDDFESFMNDEN